MLLKLKMNFKHTFVQARTHLRMTRHGRAEYSTQSTCQCPITLFFMTDWRTDKSIGQTMKYETMHDEVCVCVWIRCSLRISFLHHLKKCLNENQLNEWNWNSVNRNLLFLFSPDSHMNISIPQFVNGISVKLQIIFCSAYCQNHHFSFRFIQSDTLYSLVPTITTFVVDCLFICFIHVSNLH